MNPATMTRKGSVALTITWGVAFIVIFFIMLFFIGMSSIIGVKQIAPSWIGGGGGFSEVEIGSSEDSSLGNLASQEKLFYILDYGMISGKSVGELILENRKEEIKTELEELLEDSISEDECYFFSVDGDVLVGKGVLSLRDKDKFSRVDLFEGNQKINIGLYVKEC